MASMASLGEVCSGCTRGLRVWLPDFAERWPSSPLSSVDPRTESARWLFERRAVWGSAYGYGDVAWQKAPVAALKLKNHYKLSFLVSIIILSHWLKTFQIKPANDFNPIAFVT